MNISLRIVIGAALGMVAGYAMYRFIGCRTGACPLNSNPFVSTGIWGCIGAFMAVGSKGRHTDE